MPLAATIVTQLTSGAVRAKALYLGGVDVLFDPGGGGNRVGVPIETVHVLEAAADGVSSMDFSIDDPALAVSISNGMEVLFWDITNDRPIFRGFVQSYVAMPAFGTGRAIDVICVGVEILMDWATLATDMTFDATTLNNKIAAVVQSLAANMTGLGPIRAIANASITPNQAAPMMADSAAGAVVTTPMTFTAGTSLRECIRQYGVAKTLAGSNLAGNGFSATIDFYMGLRLYFKADVSAWLNTYDPTDYLVLTVTDTAASATVAEDLRYALDASSVVRGVWVVYTGGRVFVSDGTGILGPISLMTDTTITSAANATAAGVAYLASFATGVRGSFGLSDRARTVDVWAGSAVSLTDDQLGLAPYWGRIHQLDKTFNSSGRENWTVAFGGPRPSVASAIRRLTRDTLS